MVIQMVRRTRAVLMAFCALGMLVSAGCDTGPRRVPASGTVTLDGKPLEFGILYFNPDESKGNTARVSCTSPVRDGHFNVQTSGIQRSESGPGVPLGWYKVNLRVNMAGELPIFPGQPVVKINPKYLDPDKTPISIEVVDNPEPGHYDLKLEN
jgi:hypothetical protein